MVPTKLSSVTGKQPFGEEEARPVVLRPLMCFRSPCVKDVGGLVPVCTLAKNPGQGSHFDDGAHACMERFLVLVCASEYHKAFASQDFQTLAAQR